MKFKNTLKTIFLDPNSSKEFELDDKINVILSPSLYWVKKLSLPVKSVREVKKLLPSLFEDTLPEGNYSYYAYKSEDGFFVFAYEDKLILDTLAKKGVPASSVANVYFAQSELGKIESPLKINDFQSIYVKDEILVVIPSDWIAQSPELNVYDIYLSGHSIVLQQFGHIVNKKSLYKVSAIMLALSLLIATEYFITIHKSNQITAAQEELFEKYNLKSTIFQNKSMLKKYENIHEKQSNLREYISSILAVKLKDKEELSLLNVKNNIFSADFSGIAQGDEERIIKILNENKVKFTSSFKDETWHVEMAL
jgi:hypothetical protein